MHEEMNVPFHRPSIGQEEIDEVESTLKSGWLTTGPRTAQFERQFRAYIGVPHAQAVSSCTAGLHVSLAALKLGPGMEVITTPLTFCATINAILQVGATPVLADVGRDGNIDPASVADRLSERTRAVLPVHFGGLPCEMDSLWALARQHRLYVIEDCAHAVGSHYRGWPIGAGNPERGDCSTTAAFSFYATKNLTTGEGGMLVTHDEALADWIKVLCLHGISQDAWNRYADRGHWYYQVLASGFKYNLSDIQSAIGIHQLRKLEHFITTRERYARVYNELLVDVEELELPPDKSDCRHSWHLYTLRLNLDKLEVDRDEFIALLRREGVSTSVHFIPIPLHPFFAEFACRPENQCPEAMALYPRLVSLPLYPAMTIEELEYVASSVKKVLREVRRCKPICIRAGGY
jgi:dTDP-4-amino-4,6-dideoxygalactose transaminase